MTSLHDGTTNGLAVRCTCDPEQGMKQLSTHGENRCIKARKNTDRSGCCQHADPIRYERTNQRSLATIERTSRDKIDAPRHALELLDCEPGLSAGATRERLTEDTTQLMRRDK
jgi:hypothetical protein